MNTFQDHLRIAMEALLGRGIHRQQFTWPAGFRRKAIRVFAASSGCFGVTTGSQTCSADRRQLPRQNDIRTTTDGRCMKNRRRALLPGRALLVLLALCSFVACDIFDVKDPLPVIDPLPSSMFVTFIPEGTPATWSLFRNGDLIRSGTGESMVDSLVAGDYSLSAHYLPGWLSPLPEDYALRLHPGDIDTVAVLYEKERRLDSGPYAGSPTWSPSQESNLIAYCDGSPRKVAILDLQTGSTRFLTNGPDIDKDPDWAPDGASILFVRNSLLYGVSVETGVVTQLRIECSDERYHGNWLSDPVWAPDMNEMLVLDGFTMWRFYFTHALGCEYLGSYVDPINGMNYTNSGDAFAYGRQGTSNITYSHIRMRDRDGLNDIAITNSASIDKDPHWSPDDTRICYSSNRSTGVRKIWVVDRDGSNVSQVTFGPAADNHPAWSPDGKMIVFVRSDGDDTYLWLAAASVAP